MDNIKYTVFKSWAKMLLDKQTISLEHYNALCAEIESVQKSDRRQ